MTYEVKRVCYLTAIAFFSIFEMCMAASSREIHVEGLEYNQRWKDSEVSAYVRASEMSQKLYGEGRPSRDDLFSSQSDGQYTRVSERGDRLKIQVFIRDHNGSPSATCRMRMSVERNLEYHRFEKALVSPFVFAYSPAVFDETLTPKDVLSFLVKVFQNHQRGIEHPLPCVFQLQQKYCGDLGAVEGFRLLDVSGVDRVYPEVVDLKQPDKVVERPKEASPSQLVSPWMNSIMEGQEEYHVQEVTPMFLLEKSDKRPKEPSPSQLVSPVKGAIDRQEEYYDQEVTPIFLWVMYKFPSSTVSTPETAKIFTSEVPKENHAVSAEYQ